MDHDGKDKDQSHGLTISKVMAALDRLADNLANLGEEAAATNIRLANRHLKKGTSQRSL
jgi:hypothetical protein